MKSDISALICWEDHLVGGGGRHLASVCDESNCEPPLMLGGYSKWLQKVWADSRDTHSDQCETLKAASLGAFQGDTVFVGPGHPALWGQAQEQGL